jgi:hypothetical protein
MKKLILFLCILFIFVSCKKLTLEEAIEYANVLQSINADGSVDVVDEDDIKDDDSVIITITYVGNGQTGGAVPVDSNEYTKGEVITTKTNMGGLSRTYFTFTQWNTKADGTGGSIGFGSLVLAGDANITLYAQWDNEYEIRDVGPSGGFIFYINENYESDGWRYLELAPSVTEWDSTVWGVEGDDIPNLDNISENYEVGAGLQNTAWIVAHTGAGSTYPAQLCDALVYAGKDDWYLPSLKELTEIYYNLKRGSDINNKPYTPVGNIGESTYWSSTEVDSNNSRVQNLANLGGNSYQDNKSNPHCVRAIRRF